MKTKHYILGYGRGKVRTTCGAPTIETALPVPWSRSEIYTRNPHDVTCAECIRRMEKEGGP